MFYRFTKRALDLLITATALILLAPVMAVVAVLVRRKLGSPVLFRHPRPGYRDVTFDCIKFRTMTNERDSQGRLLPEMRRLTEFGKFLRRFSLDELPQLWSVLKGDMSLVGPRPLEVRYLPRYSAEQRRRHHVPPGITGWAQINGRNEIEWDRKFELDIWYVDHRSLGLDLKVLALTFWKVVTAAGIAKAGTTSMEEYFGPGNANLPMTTQQYQTPVRVRASGESVSELYSVPAMPGLYDGSPDVGARHASPASTVKTSCRQPTSVTKLSTP